MAIISAEDDIAYGVAKAAQDKLTKDLAFKFAPKGVRINSVLPGERVSFAGLAGLWHLGL
jgi:NAD(P)-dependent dehydrogenase (short-subunit alcohol dehydrogenase family)